MMKQMHPDWGVDRISDLLLRGPGAAGFPVHSIATVLTEDGYLVEESRMQRHPDKIRFFERAKPNQMWQSDLFYVHAQAAEPAGSTWSRSWTTTAGTS